MDIASPLVLNGIDGPRFVGLFHVEVV